MEVCENGLVEDLTGLGHGVALICGGRIRSGEVLTKAYVNCSSVKVTTPCHFDRCASAGELAFNVEKGSARMPFGGAGLIATPARPRPWSSSNSTNKPPSECPISTGGSSSSLVVADDLLHTETGRLLRGFAQLLDVTLLTRPLWCRHGEAALCRSDQGSSPSCAPTATRREAASAGSDGSRSYCSTYQPPFRLTPAHATCRASR